MNYHTKKWLTKVRTTLHKYLFLRSGWSIVLRMYNLYWVRHRGKKEASIIFECFIILLDDRVMCHDRENNPKDFKIRRVCSVVMTHVLSGINTLSLLRREWIKYCFVMNYRGIFYIIIKKYFIRTSSTLTLILTLIILSIYEPLW